MGRESSRATYHHPPRTTELYRRGCPRASKFTSWMDRHEYSRTRPFLPLESPSIRKRRRPRHRAQSTSTSASSPRRATGYGSRTTATETATTAQNSTCSETQRGTDSSRIHGTTASSTSCPASPSSIHTSLLTARRASPTTCKYGSNDDRQ